MGFFFDCVLACGLFFLISQLFLDLEQLWRSHPGRPETTASLGLARSDGVVWQLLATLTVTGLTSYGVYRLRCPATAEERRTAWNAWSLGRTWQWLAIGIVAVITINVIVTTLIAKLGVAIDPSNSMFIRKAMRLSPIFLTVFVVILAPLYEELLFRRVVFGRFLRAQQPRLGVFVSSLLFALMHEIPGYSMNDWWALLSLWLIYGAMGCVLALVYQRTQALWVSVVVHGCNNLLALLLLLLC